MLSFIQEASQETNPLIGQIGLLIIVIAFCTIVIYRICVFVEGFWVEYIKPKPLFNHFYLFPKRLNKEQLNILKSEFSFYGKLKPKEQNYFQHRVSKFIKSHKFECKQGEPLTDRKEVLISATAIMLTFGYRNYALNYVERFLIYPSVFYSVINKANHKGEFNPAYRAIILSWEDFLHGYDIGNDNFNLGIHEFVHAMHFEFLQNRSRSISAAIFVNAYNELVRFLDMDTTYKNRLVKSGYLRDYAYTNQFEFVAVLIESFMETPQELKKKFPEIYSYVKQMLNFNFAGY